MLSLNPIDAREEEIARICRSGPEREALQQHLKEIVEGAVFKGSHRSAQFLSFIVEQAMAGHFDSLKERVIGAELFGRSPAYDTGEDAIVRVTASDVRKRLLQHYGKYGDTSEYRISLPLGSYLPEIKRESRKETTANLEKPDKPQDEAPTEAVAQTDLPKKQSSGLHRWWALLLPALVIAVALTVWIAPHWRNDPTPRNTLPWSAFLQSPRSTWLIISDPGIAAVQDLTGRSISVADYANRNYIPQSGTLPQEVVSNSHLLLLGENASAIDTPIALQLAAMMRNASGNLGVHAARSIKLADLKTDDNFILLGSPRSNPWFSLFDNQLDFRFVFDGATRQEAVHNQRPRAHEQAMYLPTAMGGGTGDSYAIIALVHNVDQNGQVLLLAGANAEGTQAAANFVTNLPRLSTTLRDCGVHAGNDKTQRFELLLRLSTMAGSPNDVSVTACHLLGNTP
jgi:hypothetical protein